MARPNVLILALLLAPILATQTSIALEQLKELKGKSGFGEYLAEMMELQLQ